MMMLRKASDTEALALFDKVQANVYEALDLVAAQVADDWKSLVSVDVEYAAGPRGGVRVSRSQPGEPPRREHQNLYDSIQSHTEADDAVITASVDTDVPYAEYLEYGTAKMAPRPHRQRTFDKWADDVVDAVVAAVARVQ